MAAQIPDDEKIKAADFVIDNSGSLDATEQSGQATCLARTAPDARRFLCQLPSSALRLGMTRSTASTELTRLSMTAADQSRDEVSHVEAVHEGIAASSSIRALMTNQNRPRVRMVSGKVRILSTKTERCVDKADDRGGDQRREWDR
jgi:hypothetical protein